MWKTFIVCFLTCSSNFWRLSKWNKISPNHIITTENIGAAWGPFSSLGQFICKQNKNLLNCYNFGNFLSIKYKDRSVVILYVKLQATKFLYHWTERHTVHTWKSWHWFIKFFFLYRKTFPYHFLTGRHSFFLLFPFIKIVFITVPRLILTKNTNQKKKITHLSIL